MMSVTETSECAETSNEIPPLCQDGPFRVLEPSGTALRIRWQGAPIAQERDYKGVWRECWPAEKLIYPVLGADAKANLSEAARTRYAAHEDFRMSVPERFAKRVECFPSFQWNLLLLMNAVAKGDELAQSNLVLAYALANNHELRLKPDQTALPLALFHCQYKQREILDWLGFPGTEAMVRIFQKIEPGAVTPQRLRMFRNTLKRRPSAIQKLSHLPRIKGQVFDIFIDSGCLGLVAPRLLAEISAPDSEPSISVADALSHMQVLQHEMKVPARTALFHTLDKLSAYAERVDRDYVAFQEERQRRAAELRAQREAHRQHRVQRRKQQGQKLNKSDWPPPPLPGNAMITPLTSMEALYREGAEQNNCVASYWGQIVKGNVYIYSVRLGFERATLSIRRIHGNAWRVSTLLGRGNKLVSGEMRAYVKRWIYECELADAYVGRLL